MANDPFRGIKLSDHTPAGLDQRLFTPSPPATPPDHTPSQPHEEPPREREQRGPMTLSVGQQRGEDFNINITPTELESMRLTQQEAFELEDMWRDLRRVLGRKLAKNDIVRCALHYLIEDYHQQSDGSILARMLKGKKI